MSLFTMADKERMAIIMKALIIMELTKFTLHVHKWNNRVLRNLIENSFVSLNFK